MVVAWIGFICTVLLEILRFTILVVKHSLLVKRCVSVTGETSEELRVKTSKPVQECEEE